MSTGEHTNIFGENWLERESYGDTVLLALLEQREAAMQRLAEEGAPYIGGSAAKAQLDSAVSHIKARLGELGMDPGNTVLDYDQASLNQEQQRVAVDAAMHRSQTNLHTR